VQATTNIIAADDRVVSGGWSGADIPNNRSLILSAEWPDLSKDGPESRSEIIVYSGRWRDPVGRAVLIHADKADNFLAAALHSRKRCP